MLIHSPVVATCRSCCATIFSLLSACGDVWSPARFVNRINRNVGVFPPPKAITSLRWGSQEGRTLSVLDVAGVGMRDVVGEVRACPPHAGGVQL